MKTIIIGYADAAGLSAPEIICGPETPAADQAEGMTAAKRRHEFPKGFLRVEQYALGEPVEIAIFISEQAAEAAQDNDDRKRQLDREQRQRAAAQQKSEANLVAANKAFTIFAQKRNNAIAAVAQQKNILSANVSDRDRAAIIKKLEALQPAADTAIAEFKLVLAARDVIKNPKSPAEDVAAALEIIKDPVKWNLKSATDKAAAEKAAVAKAAVDKAAAEKAEAEKLAADKAAAEKLAGEKPALPGETAPPAAS